MIENRHIFKSNKIRGEVVSYKGNKGATIWIPFDDYEEEDFGLCWDFDLNNINDVIDVLIQMRDNPSKHGIYKEDKIKNSKKEKTFKNFYYKHIYRLGIGINLFNWKLDYYKFFGRLNIGPLEIRW